MNTIKHLIWGVTTAAAQTEGAFDKDGRGPSIWDTFTSNQKKIKDKSNNRVATNFYERFKEDIDLCVDIGLKVFRFSISWSRILPDGTGILNKKGVEFYNDVINYCLEVGIEPWITTYHWDLPQKLQNKGGWRNREVVTDYENYVAILKDHFADRVKNWVLVNEAIVCIGAGYFLGIHAPGKRGIKNFSSSLHHILLAQAKGFYVLKKDSDLHVGTAVSCTKIDPYTNSKKDQKAALKIDALMNRLCIEPYLGLGYPKQELPIVTRIEKFVQEGDMDLMKVDFDFWGVQTYAREVVKSAWYIPYLGSILVSPKKRKVPVSVMGWETYPEGAQFFLERFSKYDPKKPLWLSECGMALSDEEDDSKRITYYKKVIKGMENVVAQKINLKGILLWTLVDNFEWAEGFVPKFGIISMNKTTLDRTMKKTAIWIKEYLSTNL
ncbi:glycoside hydrolase family 1 protein [Aquimarina litoralis]|uniref:glycoside hydrolase family 1 protein n=1 Tax=Aquimarina litoralis TaxID=584605 RepID=UPI001C55D7D1|nr:family 1 glycosylhydrolase [Aquimarina litoralis]MBW1294322.1 family 1 glycosylhydrolase [Aquimarina litoralis]